MTRVLEGKLDAGGIRIALVVSRFNEVVSGRLLAGAEDCLDRHGGDAADRTVVRVPGSWELPVTAKKLADTGRFDAVVALGTLIRGETPHFDVLASQVAKGLGQVAYDSGLPVIFGVLTTDTVDQAADRAGGKLGNKGWEAALAAIEMVSVHRQIES
ncbi:6,7-dimethyl-8-ribityllumazine synthase [Acidobacteria bacterium Mor1]|nr:6,7-dimethyl-8-ribityllumazine synthase [Acidobacteria bacterium Mor1]